MYGREQFNVNENQNQRQVFGNNNNGFMRPIVGRIQQQPAHQMNQGTSTIRAVAPPNGYFSNNTGTGHVMTPTKSFQSKATASPDIKPIGYGRFGNQRETRDGNASTSSSLGLMSLPSANKSSTKPATFTKPQADFQIDDPRSKSRNSGESQVEKLRVLTGTVERVIKYGKIFQNQFCYFQVMGSVVSIADGKVQFEKTMLLRDAKGPILQLIYYSNSTHINIEDFHLGQNLRAVGRMIGNNTMSAISIRAASQDEMESLHRLSYISDYSVSAMCGDRPFESKKH